MVTRIGVHKLLSSVVVHGDTVYLAGQIGEGVTMAEQFRSALSKVQAHLGAVQSSKASILQAQIFLKDIADFGEMNEIWSSWIDPENPPARATIEARLAKEEYKVEILVIAARSSMFPIGI
jgi:enamine deaminase RidA (YjgF/YER057c/UK114 family)